jgi:PAS domain S-box-containing protein
VILLLGFLYQQQMAATSSLASIGLIAFSLVIQLLPSLVGGLYWKQAHAHGVYAGLLMGFVSWVFWLVLPLTDVTISDYSQTEILSQGAIISLIANAITYITFSKIAPARLIDKIQAEAFVHPLDTSHNNHKTAQINITNGDLVTLLTTFMGQNRCEQLLSEYSRRNNMSVDLAAKPNIQILSFCERALGGVIGSSSARALVNSVAEGKKLDFSEVINFFDGTTQAMQFNMTALLTSLESMEHGISVIDKNLNLVAWNKRYTQLYDYPEEYLAVGTPIEKLMRFNALKGELGPGDVDEMVTRRLEHLKNGTPHRFTRQRADGHVIEMVGNPLPGGGFVTSFNDITSHVEIQQALEEANIDLTTRIKKRTEEVHSINAELRLEIEKRGEIEQELIRARKTAEEANNSKTRFLALASHDIIQPLNAAKLYLSALQDAKLSDSTKDIINKLNDSVNSSEHLISTLLDISRLDQGEMAPTIEHFPLKDVLNPLISDMSLKAQGKGLVLRSRCCDPWVKADRTFTFRIIQNLLSNAVKYTDTGKVLLTCRVRNNAVQVRVYDTGIGIASDKLHTIFSDFYRVQESNETGVGLGLGVVRRLTQQIDGTVTVKSTRGKGSCFTLTIPLGVAQQTKAVNPLRSGSSLQGLKALCVDDKTENLDALSILLDKWGIEAKLANTYDAALTALDGFDADILLIDYQLDKDQNGVNLIQELQVKARKETPAAILTALHDESLKEQCRSLNISHLNKPLKPAKLRALITNMAKQAKRVNRY